MNIDKERFPKIFEDFVLPEGAACQKIDVYRACPSNKADEASFIPSWQLGEISESQKREYGQYSLSTYEWARDIKRYAKVRNEKPACKIAKGWTECNCGPCFKETVGSHVHWFLYEKVEPWKNFTIIEDFSKIYKKINEDEINERKKRNVRT